MVHNLLRFSQNRVIYVRHRSKIFYSFYINIWYIMLLCGFLWANIKYIYFLHVGQHYAKEIILPKSVLVNL